MAVQAQHPTNLFSPDVRDSLPGSYVTEGLQMPQGRSLLNAYFSSNHGGTVISEPRSGLTCNASASRKRPREEQQQQQPMHPLPPSSHPINPFSSHSIPTANGTGISAKVMPADAATVHLPQSRLLGSGATSTSGQPAASPVLISRDVLASLYHQSIEIDALVRLQSERLREGLEEARKRHCCALLHTMEQVAALRLREKEAELEGAARRNAELEEKVKRLSAEIQMWFDAAKNNEALASRLRATLEQFLVRNAAAAAAAAEEGFGDNDGAVPFPADDAQSCCFEGKTAAAPGKERWACRECGEKAACVLVLPCRHLCLCGDCEPRLGSCPVCRCAKNACLRVSMP